MKLRWCDQSKIFLRWWKLQLLRLHRKFSFLFGLFSGGDGFAKTARMFSVEGFCHRFLKRTGMKIVRKHRCPCDGLQQRPMHTEHRHEREDEKDFTKPLEHMNKLNLQSKTASAESTWWGESPLEPKSKWRVTARRSLAPPNYFSSIQTSVPAGSRSKSGIKSASARWMQPCDAGRPMDFWSAVPWM
jgi:hypothetical protein